MNALHFFHYSVLSAGIVSPPEADGYVSLTRSDLSRQVYRKIVLRSGKIVGFIFAGDIERAGIVYGLMRRRVEVTDFAETLMEPELRLLSLPPRIREHLLGPHAAPRL